MSDGALKFAQDFAMAGVSGGVVKTATAPIERIKLLLQTQDSNPKIVSGEIPRYTGIMNCGVRVAQTQGVISFWRGNGANVLRYIPQQAFNLAFKDALKRIFPKYNKETEFLKFFAVQLVAAGVGAAGSLVICYPLDFARTRLASDVGDKKTFNGIADCIGKTYKASGIRGLYNGFGASVGGVVAYRGMQLGCFDTINGMNPYKNDLTALGMFSSFAAGMASLAAAMPLSYPFDTVRRRLQMESEIPMEKRLYKTTGNCVKVIIEREGFFALYKGLAANMVRGVGAAMVPVFYEKGKVLFGL